MSKRERRRIVFTDFKAKKEDEGAIDIVLPDGSTLVIPPPVLWPDAVLEAGQDHVKAARALLGDEAYGRWTEAGGTAATLLGIIQDEMAAKGEDVGESSASSAS